MIASSIYCATFAATAMIMYEGQWFFVFMLLMKTCLCMALTDVSIGTRDMFLSIMLKAMTVSLTNQNDALFVTFSIMLAVCAKDSVRLDFKRAIYVMGACVLIFTVLDHDARLTIEIDRVYAAMRETSIVTIFARKWCNFALQILNGTLLALNPFTVLNVGMRWYDDWKQNVISNGNRTVRQRDSTDPMILLNEMIDEMNRDMVTHTVSTNTRSSIRM
jgi:hypothetical protein